MVQSLARSHCGTKYEADLDVVITGDANTAGVAARTPAAPRLADRKNVRRSVGVFIWRIWIWVEHAVRFSRQILRWGDQVALLKAAHSRTFILCHDEIIRILNFLATRSR